MYNIRHTTILIPTYKKTCYRNQMHITGPTPTLISASVQLLRNPCFRSDLFMTAFTLLLKYISAERPKILVEIFCSLFPIRSLIIPCQISQSFPACHPEKRPPPELLCGLCMPFLPPTSPNLPSSSEAAP